MKIRSIYIILGISFCLGAAALSFGQAAGPTSGGVKVTSNGGVKRSPPPLLLFFRTIKVPNTEVKSLNQLIKTVGKETRDFAKSHKGDRPAIKDFQTSEKAKLEDGIKGILTPDEFSKYQTFTNQMTMPALQADNKVLRKLKLGPDNYKKVYALKTEERNKAGMFIAVHSTDQSAVDTEITSVIADYKTKLQAILTPDQWQAYVAGTAGTASN